MTCHLSFVIFSTAITNDIYQTTSTSLTTTIHLQYISYDISSMLSRQQTMKNVTGQDFLTLGKIYRVDKVQLAKLALPSLHCQSHGFTISFEYRE